MLLALVTAIPLGVGPAGTFSNAVPLSAPRYYGTSPEAVATGYQHHDHDWEASLERMPLAPTGVSLDHVCVDRSLHANAVAHEQGWFVEYAAETMLAVRAAPNAAAPSPLATPKLAACAAKCPKPAAGAAPALCLAPGLRGTWLRSTGFLSFPSVCVAECALGGGGRHGGNRLCLDALSTAAAAGVRKAIWGAAQCPVATSATAVLPPPPPTAAPGTCMCDLRVATPSRKTTCRIEDHTCQHHLNNYRMPGPSERVAAHSWWGTHDHANPASSSATCTGITVHHSVRVKHPHHHHGRHRCGVVDGSCRCCGCALVEQDGCKPGFFGDRDPNTCEICPSGSYCPGGKGVTHSTHCPSGTTTCDASGRHCEGKGALAGCRDIDECDARDSAANDYGFVRCHEHARCTNSVGSFSCECVAGYRNTPSHVGLPGTSCVVDSGCPAGQYRLRGASCVPCDAGHFCPGGPELPQRRKCASGFTTCDASGRHCEGKSALADCRNVNECDATDRSANALAANPAFVPCAVHATCTDAPGSHGCECFAGFIGDGKRCEECAAGRFEHEHRECTAHSECKEGEVETVAAGVNNDRSCAHCPVGHKCVGDANAIPCEAGDQYQDRAGSTSCKDCESCPHWTSRVGCALDSAGACEACASCPKGYKRDGCAGTSAGTCIYVCDFDNCWIAQSKLPWHASVDNWSLHSIPKAGESAHVADMDIVTVSDGAHAEAGVLVLDGVLDLGAGIGDSTIELGKQ